MTPICRQDIRPEDSSLGCLLALYFELATRPRLGLLLPSRLPPNEK